MTRAVTLTRLSAPHPTILVSKAGCHGLEGWTTRWVTNRLEGWAQGVVVHEPCSAWRRVTSGAPQGPARGPLLLNISSNDPAQAQSARSPRLQTAPSWGTCSRAGLHPEGLGQAGGTGRQEPRETQRGHAPSPALGSGAPLQQHGPGLPGWGSSSGENVLGAWVGSQQDTSHSAPRQQGQPSSTLAGRTGAQPGGRGQGLPSPLLSPC